MAAMVGQEGAQPATPEVSSGAVPTLAPSDIHVLLVDDERLSRVVDVMMPDVDGIELLRFLRGNDAFAAVSVVMMSANEENDTVFECIRGGAEDYLLKPVTRKEVQHIWQHVWRRQQQLVVPSIQDEVADDLRRGLSGQVSVPLAALEAADKSAARSESGEPHPRLVARAPSAAAAAPHLPAADKAASGGLGATRGSTASAAASAPQPQQWLSQLQRQQSQLQQQTHQRQRQQQQPAPRAVQPPPPQAQLPAQLPPSRPLDEFLSASGAHQQHSGEEAFRVLCQVLGFLRAAHARGAALGRLRPSGLRVTASCVVLMDPAAAIPAAEEELYAAPEELFARAQSQRPAAAAASSDAAGNAASSSGSGGGGGGGGGFGSSISLSCGSTGSVSAVPAAGLVARVASPGGTAAAAAPQQRRSPAGDMFSLGLLLLQLLHPAGASGATAGRSGNADDGAASDGGEAAAAAAASAQRVLRDARHQILPSALLQGRPAEAALLTALLAPDPARRPAIDDVLRSGLLRKLHAGLTRPPATPAVQSSQPSGAAAAPAAATAAALAEAAPAPQHAGIAGSKAQPATATLPAALPAALASQLGGPAGSSAALQDFLGLARDAVAADAAALTQQLSLMDQDAAAVERCLAAVQAQAAALAARRAAAARRKHGASEQVAPGSSPTAAGNAASASPRSLSAPAVPQPALGQSAAPQQQPQPAAATSSDAVAADAAGSRKRPREAAGEAAAAAEPMAAATGSGSSSGGSGSFGSPVRTASGGSPWVAAAAAACVLPESGATAAKARRVAAALPAVDAAFFRAREAADAGSCTEGPQLSPTSQQAAASRSLQAALQPMDDATRLPPHLDAFGRDLDCFSRHGDFRVVSHLKYGDGLACPEFVCSVDFDRDDEFFATAGVSRRVKVYEYASLLDDGGAAATGGAHYPVLDLPFRCKLAAVAWNTYLKSHLLAADYAGIATLVDASAGVEVAAFAEHSKRVWSIDFSATDPQRFLSGSDDGTVRLWSINEPTAAVNIDAKANVCSVQFSPTDANLMAFGAANYRTYLYDLRNIKIPLAVIGGHSRAVSFVRFLADGRRLLTASTDSALKLWDIAAEVARPVGQPASPQLTYTGHVNEKNFVGLSVTPAGYIATGSEDNSVVAYHSSMPVPIARHCLSEQQQQPGGAAASVYGAPPRPQPPAPGGDVAMQPFVSSVTWTRGGGACVASNSQGHLRVLELV